MFAATTVTHHPIYTIEVPYKGNDRVFEFTLLYLFKVSNRLYYYFFSSGHNSRNRCPIVEFLVGVGRDLLTVQDHLHNPTNIHHNV